MGKLLVDGWLHWYLNTWLIGWACDGVGKGLVTCMVSFGGSVWCGVVWAWRGVVRGVTQSRNLIVYVC